MTVTITRFALPALLIPLALAGCGKVQEAASEKAAEKMIEATINKDGSNAKVDIHDGGVKVQGTDEKGQAFNMEMGSANISEKELGIPFYPGATVVPNQSSRFVNGGNEMLQVELNSPDDVKKVGDWYRAQLKGSTEGKMVMDQTDAQGMSMTITDSQTESSMIIGVKATEGQPGSTISLVHSRKAAAKG